MTYPTKAAAPREQKVEWPEYYAAHLSEHASDYYPKLDSPHVNVCPVRKTQRRFAALHEFELTAAEFRRTIIAKTPCRRATGAPRHRKTPSRPRLVPSSPPDDAGLLEHRALSAIEERVERLGDPRFGAIRVLDLLHNPYTVVMEKSEDPSLHQLLVKGPRRGEPNGDLALAFRNAGAWLRQSHRQPPLAHRQSRCESRADVLAAIERLTDYLRDARQGAAPLDRMQGRLAEAAGSLPERLPLGTCHGDFAPRNILVGPRGRITVFDTRARWKAPIYEDLGYLFFELRASRTQICTLGMAGKPPRLESYQAEVVSGYFDDEPAPMRPIRLFEGLALLDKWVALVHAQRTARGFKKLARSSRLAVFSRFAGRYCDRLLRRLEEPTP